MSGPGGPRSGKKDLSCAVSTPSFTAMSSPRVSIEGRSSGRADEEPFVNFQVIEHLWDQPQFVRECCVR